MLLYKSLEITTTFRDIKAVIFLDIMMHAAMLFSGFVKKSYHLS